MFKMLPTSVTSASYLLFTIIPAISVVCGWSWETGCGKWTEHLHYYVCDPDHTLQDFDRQLVNDTAAHCHVGARIENLRVVVFIKASLPAFTDTAEEDTTNTNNVGVMRDNGTLYMLDTGDERGKDGKQKTVTSVLHLEQQILRAYNNNNNNNNTSPEQHSPTLFIIVTQKPFQVRVWASADVDLSESEMRGAEEVAHASHAAHHHLHTALTLALVSVCQSIKEKGMNNYTVHWVAFTVTWIFISVFFIGGLVCVALYLRQAKKTRIRESQTFPEGEVVGLHQRASCSRYASTSPPPASDLNSNSAVAYRSTGHVLLGATDITALPSNRCSSTDHLLDS